MLVILYNENCSLSDGLMTVSNSYYVSSCIDGVLSPRTIRIKPNKPVVKEGDSLFLTCATFDARAHHNDDAPYLNFELPEMSHLLENQIHISFITSKV